jgi:hypothetical protein
LLQFSSVCDASGHLGFDRLASLLLHEVQDLDDAPKVAPSYATGASLKSLLLSTISDRVFTCF